MDSLFKHGGEENVLQGGVETGSWWQERVTGGLGTAVEEREPVKKISGEPSGQRRPSG